MIDIRAELQQRLLAVGPDALASWAGPHSMPIGPNGNPYSGGNALSLLLEARERGLTDPRWISTEQARAAGWRVREGAEPSYVEAWSKPNGQLKQHVIPVFNAVDIEAPRDHELRARGAAVNDEPIFVPLAEALPTDAGVLRRDPTERAEHILGSSGVRLEYVEQEKVGYDAVADRLRLPVRLREETPEKHYAAALGALTRSVERRLGIVDESQVAERLQLVRLFLGVETGIKIDVADALPDAWKAAIARDKHAVYRMARDANRVADYLVALAPERTLEQERRLEEGLKLIDAPELALRELTSDKSTFTRKELERYVRVNTGDTQQFAALRNAIASSPDLVQLDRNGVRYTTRTILEQERSIVRTAETLARSQTHGVDPGVVDARLAASKLSDEQGTALRHITAPGQLANVIGYAGTGKSTMLGTARLAWEDAGYRVRGIALSGIAAEGLEDGSGIKSRTIASQVFAWENGREPLGKDDIVVLDEAGMVGSRSYNEILQYVSEAGAKLVSVGDFKQLQSIEAGATFRSLVDRHGSARISTIRRQAEAWQRDASIDLAEGRIDRALGAYERHDLVHQSPTAMAAKAELIERWAAVHREAPEKSQLILAFTRRDTHDLNEQARAIMRAAGELGEDHLVQTSFTKMAIATGDRIYFRKNDKTLNVKNGSLGTITGISGADDNAKLTVQLDNKRVVEFSLSDYNAISRGLAATVHRSQGCTVDVAHYLASPMVDANLSYVAMTRHREEARLYYGKDQIPDRHSLLDVLSRDGDKDNSLDYELRAARELAMRELLMRATQDVMDESVVFDERDARELVAIAAAGARTTNVSEIQRDLTAALTAVLDRDVDALTIAAAAHGGRTVQDGLRTLSAAGSAGGPIEADLARMLDVAILRRGAEMQLDRELPQMDRTQAVALARPSALDVRLAQLVDVLHGKDEAKARAFVVGQQGQLHIGNSTTLRAVADALLLEARSGIGTTDATPGLIARVDGQLREGGDGVRKLLALDMGPTLETSGTERLTQLDTDHTGKLYEGKTQEVRVVDVGGVVDRARALLTSVKPLEVAAGLIALTGRLPIEILKLAKFASVENDPNAVMFTGRGKGIQPLPLLIPTLAPAAEIIGALSQLRSSLDLQALDNEAINRRFAKTLGEIVRREISPDLIPKDLREIYALAAFETRRPPVTRAVDAANILGHDVLDVRSVTAYTRFAPSAERAMSDVDVLRKDLQKRLMAAIGEEQSPQTQAYLRERAVELGATTWTLAPLPVNLADGTVTRSRAGRADDAAAAPTQQVHAVSERVVLGVYQPHQAEEITAGSGAKFRVPPGMYSIVGVRKGDAIEKMAIEIQADVADPGSRTDLVVGQKREAQRPILPDQLAQLVASDGRFKLNPAASIASDGVTTRVGYEPRNLLEVPEAQKIAGVRYSGRVEDVVAVGERKIVLQRLQDGSLVRHFASDLSEPAQRGASLSLAYSHDRAIAIVKDLGKSLARSTGIAI